MTTTQNSQPVSPGTITLPTRTRLAMTSGEVLRRKAENVVRRANEVMESTRVGGGVVVRVRTGDKKPADAGWNRSDYVAPPADPASSNVGLRCGDCPAGCVVALDHDIDDQATLEAVLSALGGLLNGMPLRHRANSSRVLLLALAPAGTSKVIWKLANGGKLELLANGQQAVVNGKHPSGVVLQWTWPDESEHDEPPPVNTLPTITPQQIEDTLVAAGIAFTGGLSKIPPPAALPSMAATMPSQVASQVSNALSLSGPFDIAVVEDGLDALVTKGAKFGNAEFESLVAGALNEARMTGQPGDIQTVQQMLENALSQLAGWDPVADPKRIDSFATANMPTNPRRMGSFVATVDALVGFQWRGGFGAAQFPQVNFTPAPPISGSAASTTGTGWKPENPMDWQSVKRGASAPPLIAGGVAIEGAVTVIASPGGRGKSAFSTALMAHLASGMDYWVLVPALSAGWQ